MRSATAGMLAVLAMSCMALAEEPAAQAPLYDLSQTAGMDRYTGPEDGKHLLAERGLLISPETRHQLFAFYYGGRLPYFITTDTAVHVYGIIVERSFRKLEEGQRNTLATYQDFLWQIVAEGKSGDDTSEPIAWPEPARAHAATMIAVAQRLLNPEWIPETDAGRTVFDRVRAQVEAELARIDRGRVEPSLLFGQTTDYSLLKPRGFYADETDVEQGLELPVFDDPDDDLPPGRHDVRDGSLASYFRARAFWALPMNLDDDRALSAAVLLGATACLRWSGKPSEPYERLVGPPCLPSAADLPNALGHGLTWYSHDALDRGSELLQIVAGQGLDAVRVNLKKRLAPACVPVGATVGQVESEVAPPGSHTPLITAFWPQSATPDTIMMARTIWPHVPVMRHPSGLDIAACCGNDRALELLLASEPEANRDALRTIVRRTRHARLYGRLRIADDDSEEQAPDESLDGEAEASDDRPAGLENVSENALWVAVEHLFDALNRPDVGDRHPRFMTTTAYADKSLGTAVVAWAAYRHTLALQAADLDYIFGEPESPPGYVEPNLRFWRAMADVALGTYMQLHECGIESPDLVELALLCRRAEEIAERQLNGRPLSESDDEWLRRGFGRQLASLCGYGTNMLDAVTDECGFVVDIATERESQSVLYVGAAQPRAIYVVMDYGGKLQLARGGVLSYREFLRPLDEGRLTDAEWCRMIAAGKEPAPPRWLADLGAENTLQGVLTAIREGRIDANSGVLERYASKEVLAAMLDLCVVRSQKKVEFEWPLTSPEWTLARLIKDHPDCVDREFVERYADFAEKQGQSVDELPRRPEWIDLHIRLAERWSEGQWHNNLWPELATVIARTDCAEAAQWLRGALSGEVTARQGLLVLSLLRNHRDELPHEAAVAVSDWLTAAMDSYYAGGDNRNEPPEHCLDAEDMVTLAARLWPCWTEVRREDGCSVTLTRAKYSAEQAGPQAKVAEALKRLAGQAVVRRHSWGETTLVHFCLCLGPETLDTALANEVRKCEDAAKLIASPPAPAEAGQ